MKRNTDSKSSRLHQLASHSLVRHKALKEEYRHIKTSRNPTELLCKLTDEPWIAEYVSILELRDPLNLWMRGAIATGHSENTAGDRYILFEDAKKMVKPMAKSCPALDSQAINDFMTSLLNGGWGATVVAILMLVPNLTSIRVHSNEVLQLGGHFQLILAMGRQVLRKLRHVHHEANRENQGTHQLDTFIPLLHLSTIKELSGYNLQDLEAGAAFSTQVSNVTKLNFQYCVLAPSRLCGLLSAISQLQELKFENYDDPGFVIEALRKYAHGTLILLHLIGSKQRVSPRATNKVLREGTVTFYESSIGSLKCFSVLKHLTLGNMMFARLGSDSQE